MSHEGAQFIKAITADEMEYIVDARCFESSKPLTDLVKQSETRDENGLPIIYLEFYSEVVEKLFEYFYYKVRWDKNPEERPEFKIDPSIALNLMVCAYKYGA